MKSRAVAASFGMLLLTTALAEAQCYSLTTQIEYCPGCPGFAWCVCLYGDPYGHPCQDDTSCNSRRRLVTSFPGYGANGTPTWCTIRRECASQYGGLCHPTLNPCIYTGPPVEEGSFVIYSLGDPCNIAIRDRRPGNTVDGGG